MTYYFWLGADAEKLHELEAQWDFEEGWGGDFASLTKEKYHVPHNK